MKKTVKVIIIAVVAAALGIFLWSALCAEAGNRGCFHSEAHAGKFRRNLHRKD